ncbi:immunoglobulin lambda-like polypeptide 1 [Notamacropus eugenii]|uniref:immunoglobulin lambda-like polypeptide 1 n=1 Tax=Notamacropus eugenii TaxID=9315 RepID=UPI003B67DBC5
MPHPSTQTWALARPALSTGPSTLLLLLALAPSALCQIPEKEREFLPGKESSGLRGSQAGEPWDPRVGVSQQKASPNLGSKELRFPDQQGRRGPRRTCRHPESGPNSETQPLFGSGTRLIVLSQPKAAPTVNVFAPSQEELDTKKATLVCLLNGFYPSAVEVSWTKDGSPVSQGVSTATPSRQSDNKYSTSSFLSLSADQWLSANIYICKVTHDGKVIQKELSRSQCP